MCKCDIRQCWAVGLVYSQGHPKLSPVGPHKENTAVRYYLAYRSKITGTSDNMMQYKTSLPTGSRLIGVGSALRSFLVLLSSFFLYFYVFAWIQKQFMKWLCSQFVIQLPRVAMKNNKRGDYQTVRNTVWRVIVGLPSLMSFTYVDAGVNVKFQHGKTK